MQAGIYNINKSTKKEVKKVRCHYREKQILSGNFLEVEVYPVFAHPRAKRGKKNKPTSEVQKILNMRNAQKELTRKINTNFKEGDLLITVDYDNAHAPDSDEQWKKDIQNFIRRVKRLRKNKDISELKYIAVFEKGKKSGRRHTHIIMNKGLSRDELEALWGKGWANCKRLQPNEYGLSEIAGYICKEPLGSRRWISSKNLAEPIITQDDYKMSRRKAKEMQDRFEERDYFENLYPGFCFLNCGTFYNDVNGGVYIEVQMTKKRC